MMADYINQLEVRGEGRRAAQPRCLASGGGALPSPTSSEPPVSLHLASGPQPDSQTVPTLPNLQFLLLSDPVTVCFLVSLTKTGDC